MKVGDFVVERLHAWGVRRIYGYPGDGINGVIGALQRAGNIEFIQVRHEEMAAFMAVAHAKFTGELGVCLSTGGPGATHLITGLYDGKLDHAPVLAICGQAEATVRGASYQQELNLDRMFADVAGFVQEASPRAAYSLGQADWPDLLDLRALDDRTPGESFRARSMAIDPSMVLSCCRENNYLSEYAAIIPQFAFL